MQTLGADLVGMIENQGRTELANRSRAVAPGARHFQQGLLVQIVAAEMLVGIEDDRIGFEERGDGATRRPDRIAGVDRVAEVAGVAEIVTGREPGRIGGGKGRKQRVRITEIHALVADLGHCRRGLRADDTATQTVRYEQDEIAGRVALREPGSGGQQRQSDRQQDDRAVH